MGESRKFVMITGSSIGFELAKLFVKDNYDVARSGSSNSIYDFAKEIEKLNFEAYPFKSAVSTYGA